MIPEQESKGLIELWEAGARAKATAKLMLNKRGLHRCRRCGFWGPNGSAAMEHWNVHHPGSHSEAAIRARQLTEGESK